MLISLTVLIISLLICNQSIMLYTLNIYYFYFKNKIKPLWRLKKKKRMQEIVCNRCYCRSVFRARVSYQWASAIRADSWIGLFHVRSFILFCLFYLPQNCLLFNIIILYWNEKKSYAVQHLVWLNSGIG